MNQRIRYQKSGSGSYNNSVLSESDARAMQHATSCRRILALYTYISEKFKNLHAIHWILACFHPENDRSTRNFA